MSKKILAIIFAAIMAMSSFSPAAKAEGATAAVLNSDVEFYADELDLFYLIDKNILSNSEYVFCEDADHCHQKYMTNYKVDQLLVKGKRLYVAVGSIIRVIDLVKQTSEILLTAKVNIDSFSLLENDLYYLADGSVLAYNLHTKETRGVVGGNITSFWLEDAAELCYMCDLASINHLDLNDSTITQTENIISDLGDHIELAPTLESEFGGAETLATLQTKFPSGKYWNHVGKPGAGIDVNNQNGYTSLPCPVHGNVGNADQTCNGFSPDGATLYSWQCMGYAEKCGFDVTGYNPRVNANGWKTYTDSSALDNLKAGDIVRYKNNNHSIYVTAVSGNTVTYTDCNSDGHCVIRWGATISKSTLKSTFTHVRQASSAASLGSTLSITSPSDYAWLSPSNPGNVTWSAVSGASYYRYAVRELKKNTATGAYEDTDNLLTPSSVDSNDGYRGVKTTSRSFSLNKVSNGNLNAPLQSAAAYKVWVGAFDSSYKNIGAASIVILMNTEQVVTHPEAPKLLNPAINCSKHSENLYVGISDQVVDTSSKLTIRWRDTADYYMCAVKALDSSPDPSDNEVGQTLFSYQKVSGTTISLAADKLAGHQGKWLKLSILTMTDSGSNGDSVYYYFKLAAARPEAPMLLSPYIRGTYYSENLYCGQSDTPVDAASGLNIQWENTADYYMCAVKALDGFPAPSDNEAGQTLYVYQRVDGNSIFLSTSTLTNYKGQWIKVSIRTMTNSGSNGDSAYYYFKLKEEELIHVTGVSVSPTNAMMTVGEKQQLTAMLLPMDAANKNVTWSVSDPDVATVSSNGLVTAKAEGYATVIVKTEDGGFTASCAITVEPETIAVTGITVDPESALLYIGDTVQLSAVITPSNATDKEVTWETLNPGIATVSQDGIVTAVAEGNATIVARTRNGGKSNICAVTVERGHIPVKNIEVDQTMTTLTIGGTQQLTATVTPANATNKDVAWASSNPSVASVSSTGLVTAKTVGTATITATTADGGKTATCTINVAASAIPVTGVMIEPSALSLVIGGTQQLTATVTPVAATNKAVAWTSSDTSVASVSSDGLVAAKAFGTATITATTADGGKTATCTINVAASAIPVTGVMIEPSALSLVIGGTQQLTATVTPVAATNKNVIWSSSNTSVADVSSMGLVTAKAAGMATIVVSSVDGGKIATCSVVVTSEILDPVIKIHNWVDSRTVDYRTTITFSVDDVQNPVDGASVHWFINGQDKGASDTYIVKEAKATFTVQAKYMRGNTALAESETETVTVKTGFFARLKAFFRALFGRLPKVVQEYLGIEIIEKVLP